MAWWLEATRMEIPENATQDPIIPDQLIFHSIAAPWDEDRIFEFWRDSTNLESHLGVAFDGEAGQYVSTTVRADANYQANRRPDGHGAISAETASNLEHTDPWTEEQIETLIRFGVWAHEIHGIPLRICRAWDDPGYGYHSMFPEWSVNGTACPGPARIKQFRERVFPAIVARATGANTTPEEEMPDYVNLGVAKPYELPADGGFSSIVFTTEWSDTANQHVTDGSVFVQGPASFTGSLSLTLTGLPVGEVVQVRMSEYEGGTWKADHPTHDVVGNEGVTTAMVPLVKRIGAGRGMRVRLANQSGTPVTVAGAVLTALTFKEA
jgi:hypothetical protein